MYLKATEAGLLKLSISFNTIPLRFVLIMNRFEVNGWTLMKSYIIIVNTTVRSLKDNIDLIRFFCSKKEGGVHEKLCQS
jgi:hypothetical protein